MANDNKVTIELTVDSADALKAIEQFGTGSVKTVKKVESSVDSLSASIKSAFLPITIAIATVTSAFRIMSGAIDEAAKDSLQFKQIDSALRGTGEGGQIATQAIVDFADAMENATGVSDDLVKQSFLTAKGFGISAEQAKKLTEAALNLSAATGIDLDTATRQLGATVDGTIGRLGNLGAEFRNLSTDQLKSLGVIDLVNQKFGGAAVASFDTFAGATSGLTNAFDDLLKALGKLITESGAVIAAIKGIASAINSTAELVPKIAKIFNPTGESDQKKREEATRKLIDQMELIGNSSSAAAPKVKSLVESLSATGGLSTDKFENFAGKLEILGQQAVKSTGLTGKAAEDARKKFDDLAKSVNNAGADELTKAEQVRKDRLKIYDQAVKDGVVSAKELAKTRIDIENEYNAVVKKSFEDIETLIGSFASTAEKETRSLVKTLEKIDKLESKGVYDSIKAQEYKDQIISDFTAKRVEETKKATQKILDDEKEKADKAKAYLEGLVANPIEFILKPDFENSAKNFGAIAASVLNSALDGKSGAVKAFSGAIAAGINSFAPGLGGVFGSIFEKLSAGKDQAKAFVKEFVSSIPEIVTAVLEALPAVLEGIAEVFSRPSFWVGMVKAYVGVFALLPNLFITAFKIGLKDTINNVLPALAAVFSKIGPAIGEAFSNFFSGLRDTFFGFINGIGPALQAAFTNIFQGIGDAIMKAFGSVFEGITSFFSPLIDALNALREAIEKSGSLFGKGGGQGVIKETIGRLGNGNGGFKLAGGGIVPGTGTGDTIPAMLTPGEMVVPTDLVGQLANFLGSQGGGSGATSSDAILMAILQAVQQPVTVQSEVKVNQSAFADIILQLNRQNQRLRA